MREPNLPRLAATLLTLAAAGCSSTSVYTGAATGAHHTTGTSSGRSSTSSTSTSGTASSGSTGTTGTTSGAATTTGGATTSGNACGADWEDVWYDGGYLPDECDAGLVELKGRLTNVAGFDGVESPPLTAPFTAMDALNPTIIGHTAPCGVYYYCVPQGTEITAYFSSPNFYPVEVATLKMEQSNLFGNGITDLLGLEMFPTSAIMYITSMLNPPSTLPTKSSTLAASATSTTPACAATRAGASRPMTSMEGW